MAGKGDIGSKIVQHPFFANNTDQDATNAVAFVGYIGAPSGGKSIILYASLDDLSASVELATSDILHVADLPETILPFGAKQIWVRKDAKVIRRHVATAEESGSPQKRQRSIEIRRGRLRMIARRRSLQRGDCNCDLGTNCVSGNCISPCSYDCFSEPT